MTEASSPLARRESTDDRRAAIAKAARELIVEKGVEGLRTRDIAERVGINVATLHYHVPTKEALIELVAESLQFFFMHQNITRPRANLSAVEQLELEFVDFRETTFERPEIMLVFSELMERARRDERIAEAILPLKRVWRQMLVSLLTEGVREGAYREDLDPDACATIIMSTLIGFCRNRHKEPAAYDRVTSEIRRAIRKPGAAVPDLSNSTRAARQLSDETSKE